MALRSSDSHAAKVHIQSITATEAVAILRNRVQGTAEKLRRIGLRLQLPDQLSDKERKEARNVPQWSSARMAIIACLMRGEIDVGVNAMRERGYDEKEQRETARFAIEHLVRKGHLITARDIYSAVLIWPRQIRPMVEQPIKDHIRNHNLLLAAEALAVFHFSKRGVRRILNEMAARGDLSP